LPVIQVRPCQEQTELKPLSEFPGPPHGVSVERLMTDNGSAYKSFAFRDLLTEHAITHKCTRPYTPRTNGKAERFIQTSLREWAYAHTYETSHQRTAQLKPWLVDYNTVRTHSGIKHLTPMLRLNNLLGNDTGRWFKILFRPQPLGVAAKMRLDWCRVGGARSDGRSVLRAVFGWSGI
jgi:hypothetical protein